MDKISVLKRRLLIFLFPVFQSVSCKCDTAITVTVCDKVLNCTNINRDCDALNRVSTR